MNNDNWRQLDIRYWAVLASLALSLYTFLLPQTLNDDSYLFIRSAEIFLDEGLRAALSHYSWASYSVLIGLVSLLGISLIHAALLINACFFAILTFAFISIVKEIDDRPRVLVLAALCVLFYPELNEYRYLIIRDVGFWSLVLLSTLQLAQYCKSAASANAIGFSVLLIGASAFRLEAIAYLVFIPWLFLLIRPSGLSKNSTLRLMGVSLASLALIAILLLVFGINVFTLAANFVATYTPFILTVFQPDMAQSNAMANAIFGDYAANFSDDYLTLFIATGLFSVLIASMIGSLGWPVFVIFTWGALAKIKTPNSNMVKILLSFSIINFVIIFFFVYVTRFLPSRYAMIFAIMLVTLLPSLIYELYLKAGELMRSSTTIALCLLLIYCSIDSYYTFGKSKDYIAQTITSLVELNLNEGQLITNEPAIAYYTGLVNDYDRIPRIVNQEHIDRADRGDYFAVEFNLEMRDLLELNAQENNLELVSAFPAQPDERILVYRKI